MINQRRTISRDALGKALADAKRRNFDSSTEPPKGGSWDNEHSHKTAVSTISSQTNKIFVVGVVDQYHNNSLDDKNWVVYAYDMNGKFIEKIKGEQLGGKFFMTLTYIQ